MKSRLARVVALALLLAAAPLLRLPAQTVAAGDTALRSRVDRVFASWDRTDSPGCALGVYRGGRIEYARGYGMAHLELGVAISPRSVFDIGSTSKQFTAMSLLLLAQQQKLSLDDDIRRFLTELPDYGKRITIRHLLTHTSGLRDYLTLWNLAGVDDADLTTDADAYALLTRQRELNFAPGEQWLYSNSGFFLASMIVQRASGRTLARFAEEEIFQKLGMRHTRFNDDHMAVIADRATGYAPRRGPSGGFATAMSNFEQTGDGAVQTSIEDLLLWDENFYSGKVGGTALLDAMQTPAVLNDGRKQTYALGLTVSTYRGLRTVSHGGAWAGYRAELLRFPDQHLSIACLCNLASTNPSSLARQVAEIYLGAQMRPAEATVAAAGAASPPPAAAWQPRPEELAAFAGEYFSSELDTSYRLAVADGKLVLHRRRGPPLTLEANSVDVFRFGGTRLRFSRERGRVTGFIVDAGRTRNLRFDRR